MRPLLGRRHGAGITWPLVIVLTAAAAGCAAPADSKASDVATAVMMTDDFRFEPAAVTIRAGEAVEWRNASHFIHTATDDPKFAGQPGDAMLPPGAQAFNSGELHPGNSYRHVLMVPGIYRYFCVPHEGVGMLGRITVLPP